MGMSVGRRRRRTGRPRPQAARRRHHGLMSEINVTPFVDVMLVLLIIFMVAAPLMTVGVPIDLPETQAKALNADTKPITVSVNADGQIYLQETRSRSRRSCPSCRPSPRPATRSASSCAATRTADYGTVMQVMARISAAGFKNLGLVTCRNRT
jgi:biopolymer transport protein TolR